MEKMISEQRVFDGKIFRVAVADVLQADGRQSKREIVRHNGGSAVVLVDERGEIALVRQYRAAMGRFMLELPAGKLDAGEDPLVCAKRELREETGLLANRWRKLCEYVSSPGFCDEIIHIFLAQQPTQGERCLDEGEDIDVVFMPLAHAVRAVMDGEIGDGKTISGVMMAHHALGCGAD
jgi:ADP-ribose pyrophosphatase